MPWPNWPTTRPSVSALANCEVCDRCDYSDCGTSSAFAAANDTAAPVKGVRRVLVFNDLGSISSPGFAAIDQAIFAGLQKSPYQIEFYNENLETTLFSDPDSQRGFKEWYVQKYRDRKPDVIIAVGQSSLKFMAGSLRDCFPWISVCRFSQRPRRSRKIKASTAKSEVRLLDDERRSHLAAAALNLGAVGYVLKHSAVSELLKAVSEVLQGKPYMTAKLQAENWADREARARQLSEELTPRQKEVLQLRRKSVGRRR